MKKLLAIGQRIEDSILVVAFVVMVLAMFMQVVNRNFLHLPISWLEEVAVFSMIYLALLGTEAGLRDGSQIAVTAVVDRLPGRLRLVVQLLAKALVLLFSGTILVSSIRIVGKQMASGQTSPALQLPMTVPYFAFVLAFGIIVLVQGATFIRMLKRLITGESEAEAEPQPQQQPLDGQVEA